MLTGKRPELLKQIHPSKNPGIIPDQIPSTSTQEIIWIYASVLFKVA